ncbi:hypothetical protein TcasGA2_TC031820 [Tribolium castaneum]|uniref:Uncharacterized protein n=1 Tax=Tribolium castaneum TaxID=7070 RepID=A0A139WPS1_TRICA|nr:hypothetical protein TcasGA2_TC031820 [Tribolium castaneum]
MRSIERKKNKSHVPGSRRFDTQSACNHRAAYAISIINGGLDVC